MDKIKEGDVVQLKSGGPKMTVKWVESSEVACTWFKNDEPVSSTFPLSNLKAFE